MPEPNESTYVDRSHHFCPECGDPCTCRSIICAHCDDPERDFDWNDADEIAEAE